jgi:hypothetical protein
MLDCSGNFCATELMNYFQSIKLLLNAASFDHPSRLIGEFTTLTWLVAKFRFPNTSDSVLAA